MSHLIFKVYSPNKRLMASTEESAAALMLVAFYGDGSSIKANGRIIWRQGEEGERVENSYDLSSTVLYQRMRAHHAQRMAKSYA